MQLMADFVTLNICVFAISQLAVTCDTRATFIAAIYKNEMSLQPITRSHYETASFPAAALHLSLAVASEFLTA